MAPSLRQHVEHKARGAFQVDALEELINTFLSRIIGEKKLFSCVLICVMGTISVLFLSYGVCIRFVISTGLHGFQPTGGVLQTLEQP
jgi:hypothetical protein